MTALIDGDAILYIVGWNFKDIVETSPEAIAEVHDSVDTMLDTICTMTHADYYLGALSRKSFRDRVYLYAPYKGNRKEEKPTWFDLWKPIIEGRLIHHGFFYIDDLEADDIVAAAGTLYNKSKQECVICSPDKDLRQIPGIHFDYKKGTDVEVVLPEQAERHFWNQMLVGDTADNIKALPGLGEVKVKKILDEVESIQYPSTVLAQYEKYFGNHYGKVIFTETMHTVQMVGPDHAFWPDFEDEIKDALARNLREYKQTQRVIFESPTTEVFPWVE